jgi:hypothetical protein
VSLPPPLFFSAVVSLDSVLSFRLLSRSDTNRRSTNIAVSCSVGNQLEEK